MALDGIVIANVVHELSAALTNGRINKIAQPEADELLFTIKTPKGQQRLLISANASLPLIYLTSQNKVSPLTAPNFCMLLRKHLNSSKILSIRQPGLERVIDFEIEHLNEMGDVCIKHIIVELMGKHSNIIFCDEKNTIIDSIKHVSAQMSSIREVLPGRDYFIPETTDKCDPLTVSKEEFYQKVYTKDFPAAKAVYTSLTGFSPVMAEELLYTASIDSSKNAASLDENEQLHLYNMFTVMMSDVTQGIFTPCIAFSHDEPVEFASLMLNSYSECELRKYDTISEVLEKYYATRNTLSRIRQKSVDLRKIVSTALERNVKKLDLQEKQLKDTEKRDKFKVYGELINTYGYGIEEGAASFQALNYYTNEEITIPLDTSLTPRENATKYFDRYNKLKRTFEAVTLQIAETKEDIAHLESIQTALDIALQEEDLAQVKEELIEYGYIKRKGMNKKAKFTSKPFHYLSSDGYHMYVGKNNFQNEELTFKFATGNDWWFHAKDIPGSHVIVKTEGNELPDRTFEEAAALAAYYSKGRNQEKVEVDYSLRKNIKKPNAAKPGFVIYHTNYSMVAKPDISRISIAGLSH